jgi:electron transfer flavoprotein alpha subunit
LDTGRLEQASRQATQIQTQLWKDVTELTKTDRSAVMASYMGALNETIQFQGRRVAALENRIPPLKSKQLPIGADTILSDPF